MFRPTNVPLLILIVGVASLVLGPLTLVRPSDLVEVWADGDLRSAAVLTAVTSLVSTTFAMAIALPVGTRLARGPLRWGPVVRAAIDLPLTMPPMVIGLCLLLLFRGPLRWLDDAVGVSLSPAAVVLAQVAVATSLAVRLVESAVAGVPVRLEQVVRTLGASPWQAWREVTWPEARGRLVAAALVTWARAFGEFGPVLLFAGVTRGHTEVLSTAIHLEYSSGRLGVAAAVSLWMMLAAGLVVVAVHGLTGDAPPEGDKR